MKTIDDIQALLDEVIDGIQNDALDLKKAGELNNAVGKKIKGGSDANGLPRHASRGADHSVPGIGDGRAEGARGQPRKWCLTTAAYRYNRRNNGNHSAWAVAEFAELRLPVHRRPVQPSEAAAFHSTPPSASTLGQAAPRKIGRLSHCLPPLSPANARCLMRRTSLSGPQRLAGRDLIPSKKPLAGPDALLGLVDLALEPVGP